MIGRSYPIWQVARHDPHFRQFFLAHEFVGGVHDRCFLLCLDLFGDAFGAIDVQGGVAAAQEGEVRLVDQVEEAVVRFMEQTVFAAPGFGVDVVRRPAGCGPENVAGQGFIVREFFAGEHVFDAQFIAQSAVGETPAKTFFQGVVLGLRHAPYHPAHALSGDGVGIVFAFHEDELAMASVFLVEGKDGVGGRA